MTTTSTYPVHVVHAPNPLMRTYHIRLADLGDNLPVMKIIPGVVDIASFTPYEFTATIGEAFAWEEVEPSILAIIADAYGCAVDDLSGTRKVLIRESGNGFRYETLPPFGTAVPCFSLRPVTFRHKQTGDVMALNARWDEGRIVLNRVLKTHPADWVQVGDTEGLLADGSDLAEGKD